MSRAVGPEEQVAHGAADQVQPMHLGGREAVDERRQFGEHGGEAIGDHGAAQANDEAVARPGPLAAPHLPVRPPDAGSRCLRPATVTGGERVGAGDGTRG